MNNDFKKQSSIDNIKQIAERMNEASKKREAEQVVYLPLLERLIKMLQPKRGAPNSFLRSALFAAIQSKDRVYLDKATLFSQQGFTVKFTGKQLNQEDMTIWLTLIHYAQVHPLGTVAGFTAYAILNNIGLGDGGEQRKVLNESIKRLTACLVEISSDKKIYGASLVESFLIDEESGSYKVRLNRELINLFGNNDWTALDWNQRKQLKRKPLASKLHEYYSSHKNPVPVTIEFLYQITGSRNKQLRDFKRRLKVALEELVTIGFLESYSIEDDKVTVFKKDTNVL